MRYLLNLLVVLSLCSVALVAEAATHFRKGGEWAWFHDEHNRSGFFHTYDQFRGGGKKTTPRKVHVFLPRNYEEVGNRYPVIYMNDGQTAFFPGGEFNKTWAMANILDSLNSKGRSREVIVVAVHSLNRDREYTHEAVMGKECCGLPNYAEYLHGIVKPFIDTNYRTLATPEATVVMGSSHGGLAAFYTAMRHPESFGNVIAMSPSFWVGLDSVVFPPAASLRGSSLIRMAHATLSSAQPPRVYLDWGLVRSGGFHNSFIEEKATLRGREMVRLLDRDYNYDSENLAYVQDASGQHTEESWARRTPQALRWIFQQ